MSGNRLTSLAGIEAAKNLTSFTAAQNQIQSLNISGTQSSLKELSLSGNALKNLEGVNQFKALENLDVSQNKITSVAISTPNNTISYIDLSHNFIPKSELELNENRIPKALAQYFPAVKGGSIENNPLIEEKKEEKEASKKEGTAKSVDTNEAKSSPVEE